MSEFKLSDWERHIKDLGTYQITVDEAHVARAFPSQIVEAWLQLLERQLADSGLQWEKSFSPAAKHSLRWHLGHVLMESLFPCLRKQSGGAQSSEALIAFEVQLLATPMRLEAFLAEFQGLVYLIAQSLHVMHGFILRFDQAMQADQGLLQEHFAWSAAPGRVQDVSIVVVHGLQRMVWVLLMESGDQLVYKPTTLAAEAAFYKLVGELNDLGANPELRACRVLSRTDYGWMEYAHRREIADSHGVRAYFQRMGALLAITYTYQSQSFHCTNVVANGEYPLATHVNTLITVPGWKDEWMEGMRRPQLLPVYGNDQLCRYNQAPGIPLDSDAVPLGVVNTVGADVPQNYPFYQGEYLGAEDYVEDVVKGFQQMYQLILRYRDERGGAPALLKFFDEVPYQVRLRSTLTYEKIFEAYTQPALLLSPEHLENGIRNALLHWSVEGGLPPELPSMVDAELISIMRREQPFFDGEMQSRDLYYRGEVICENFFPASVKEQLLPHIDSMSAYDLLKMQGLIRHSLLPSRVSVPLSFSTPLPLEEKAVSGTEPSSDELLDAAAWVGEALRQRLCLDEGLADGQRWLVDELPMNSYFGLAGIALFYAALASVDKSDKWSELTQSLVERMLQRSRTPAFCSRHNCYEGLRGRGGIIFASTAIGRMTGNADAQKLAESMAQAWLEWDPIIADADELMTLVAVSQCLDAGWQSIAERCKDRLWHKLMQRSQAQRAADVVDANIELWSLGKGVTAYAYGLLRIGQALDDEVLEGNALAELQHIGCWVKELCERDAVIREMGSSYSLMEGISGITLAEIDSCAKLHQVPCCLPLIKRDAMGLDDSFHAGQLGLIHCYWRAGWALGDPQLRSLARTLIGKLLHRHAWQQKGDLSRWEHPGLMLGLAGLGYLLMELSQDELLLPDPFLLR